MSVRAAHLLVKHEESRRLASWKDPEGVQIKARTKAQAHEILQGYLATINSASDPIAKFQELATTNSDCSSAKRGGDLGDFTRGQMQKPFEDAAFALGVGQITQSIVDSGSGSHLIV